jgi:hypothetical protein
VWILIVLEVGIVSEVTWRLRIISPALSPSARALRAARARKQVERRRSFQLT